MLTKNWIQILDKDGFSFNHLRTAGTFGSTLKAIMISESLKFLLVMSMVSPYNPFVYL